MSGIVRLRAVRRADLPIFFEQQLDPDANHMAAFTAEDPTNRAAFDEHWDGLLASENVTIQTVLYNEQVAGHIEQFALFGQPSIGYWIGKSFWGQGIATRALRLFLEQVTIRPLYARAASDNLASIRVLEKCGFTITGTDTGYAHARQAEIEEVILTLPK